MAQIVQSVKNQEKGTRWAHFGNVNEDKTK